MKYSLLKTLFIGVATLFLFSFAHAQNVTIDTEDDTVINDSCTDLSYYMSAKYTRGPGATAYLSQQSVGTNTNGESLKLQEFLKEEGYMSKSTVVSGRFGPATQLAVKKFQKTYNLSQTGATGPLTRSKIKEVSCSSDGDDSILPPISTTYSCDGIVSHVPCAATSSVNTAPKISSITPNTFSGTKVVTISGANFTRSGNKVYLDGYSATSSRWYTLATNLASNGNTLTVIIPSSLPCPTYRNGGVGCPAPQGLQLGVHTLTVGNSSGVSDAFQFTLVGNTTVTATSCKAGNKVLLAGATSCSSCMAGHVPNTGGTGCIASASAAEIACRALGVGGTLGSGYRNYLDPSGKCIDSVTGLTLSASTQSAPVPEFSFNLSNNEGDQTATTAKVRWYGENPSDPWSPKTCVATGDWSGTKEAPTNGDANTIRKETITRGVTDKRLTLTCISTAGVKVERTITVGAVTSGVSATTPTTPTIALTINGLTSSATRFIEAVGNRTGAEQATKIDGDWTSDVDVKDCVAGPGFTQYQTPPVLTQTSPRSGTIRGSIAQRSIASTYAQTTGYTVTCRASVQGGQIGWSNEVLVDVCDYGFHVERTAGFGGGNCVANTPPANMVVNYETTSVTRSPLDSKGCIIAVGERSCPITVTWRSSNTTSLRLNTYPNGINGAPELVSSSLSSQAGVVFGVGVGGRQLAFVGDGGRTEWLPLSAQCVTGSQADSTGICVSNVSVPVTGSVISSRPGCTIPVGESTCSVQVTWNLSNMTPGSIMKIGSSLYTSVIEKNISSTGVGGSESMSISLGASDLTLSVRGPAGANLSQVTLGKVTACPSSAPWNAVSASCVASVVQTEIAPTVTTFTITKASQTTAVQQLPVGYNENMIWTFSGNNNPTYYMYNVNGGNFVRAGQASPWTVTPNTAALALNITYKVGMKACNNAGCAPAVYQTVNVLASLNKTLNTGMVLGIAKVCTDLPINLHRGMEKPSVTKLQDFLLSQGFMSEKPTGFYGDKTIEAVKGYQSSRGLPVTGMLYEGTRATILEESCQ